MAGITKRLQANDEVGFKAEQKTEMKHINFQSWKG